MGPAKWNTTRSGARGGGAAWTTRGGREGQVARGAVAASAIGTDSGVVGTTPKHARAGENGRWAGCPGGFESVL
jgi:hypothetical protein